MACTARDASVGLENDLKGAFLTGGCAKLAERAKLSEMTYRANACSGAGADTGAKSGVGQ